MREITDKRLRADQFRQRILAAMNDAKINQSDLARRAGVDRSTISQLLKSNGARLPNAQVVAECAAVLGVSADWLLSLTNRPESAAQIMARSLSLTKAPRALVDQQIFDWHKEASGYKIRHVPATLPDMLKTREVLEWEYSPHLGRSASQAIGATHDGLSWMRSAQSDYETAFPMHELSTFAHAQGYYADIPLNIRIAQIDHLLALNDQLYPRLRIYLFDARRVFSAPLTVFGPLMAVLYAGQNYVAFRDTERVQAFTQHFDNLVREAEISARDFPNELQNLRDQIT